MAALLRGRLLGNRYRVEGRIGEGGMGTVVTAIDTHTSLRVALKLPHNGDLSRIQREAAVAARLTGPHVARVLDTGTCRDGDAVIPFVAFEYLEGVDLATWLAARGPLPVGTAAAIVMQACDGLVEAHALGIVHRDLKPANLFLTTAATVKLLDFGISRSRLDDRITTTGALVGSPAYMPPERMRPATSFDSRSDLWSLGVVLYEAVSGRLPFESSAFPDLCLKILLDEMPPLAGPAAFVALVRQCLAKDPDDRVQSAMALREALAPFAIGSPQLSVVDLVRPSSPCRTSSPPRVARAGVWAALAVAVTCLVSDRPPSEARAAVPEAMSVAPPARAEAAVGAHRSSPTCDAAPELFRAACASTPSITRAQTIDAAAKRPAVATKRRATGPATAVVIPAHDTADLDARLPVSSISSVPSGSVWAPPASDPLASAF